ncbi:hypothetical protein JHK82_028144 [Glycine max]|nr:hypothetical protein JHK85_028808 [Glycine max]KAG5127309.1 hypothetical protein JHK82_028144 [Glycine max]KAG5151923.1 hypothetical protein JHK84_028395 [Glycine max]
MGTAVGAVDPLGELVKSLYDVYQKAIELSWDGEELIKYPTHDLLVKPSLDDLVLSSRPCP